MNLELAVSLRPTVRKNVVRPPAFEISAAPDCNMFQERKLKRAINPSAASPFWRTNVPIGMIIERNQDEWLLHPTKPESRQIVKIARSIENKRRDALRKFAIKLFDQARRRAKTQACAPLARLRNGQAERLISPRVVEIEVNYASQRNLLAEPCLKPGVAFLGQPKIFSDFGQSRIEAQRLLVLKDCL